MSEALNFQGPPLNQSVINYTLAMGPSFLYVSPNPQPQRSHPAYLHLRKQSFAATEPTSDAYLPARALTLSLQQAPAVSKALWPSLTNTTTIPHNTSIPSILSAGLGLLMRDIPTFVAFAAHGVYSSAHPPEFTPTDDNAALVSAAQTYSTSSTLKRAGWYAVLQGPNAASRDYTSVTLTQGGVGYTNSSGAALYESPTTKKIYSFRYGGKDKKPPLSPIQLLKKTDNQNWASLEVLFDGASNCTAHGPQPALVGLEADGTLDFACLSSLPAVLACGEMCPTARRVGEKCPFAVEKGC